MTAAASETPTVDDDPTQQSSHWTGDIWIQDHWTEEEKAEARDRLAASSRYRREKLDEDDENKSEQRHQEIAFQQFQRNASTNWNAFYNQNKTNFFKDRHYLQKSFPEELGWLYDETLSPPVDDGGCNVDFRIVEVGCGVGNAALPLLEQHSKLMQNYAKNLSLSSEDATEMTVPRLCPPQLHIHCLDFAPKAIQLLKKDVRFGVAAREGRATAHVYDLSSTHPSTIDISAPDDYANCQSLANSADVALLLFCISAIGPHPSPNLRRAARNVIDMLRPGGILVMRDYGRLDEAQMKLCNGDKELSDNFYRKGDGTGCYYFTLEDVKDLFVNKDDDAATHDKLEQLELDYVQRVYRNRRDGTTRRRVWVQGRFRKPVANNRADIRDAVCVEVDPLKVFFDDSVRRWDEHYEALPTKIPSPLSLPSNLYHLFPNEFLPWLSWQSSKRKGKPENQFQTICGTQTHFTAVDLGCGLGNETLLNLMEWQLVRHEEDHRQRLDQEECGFFSSACLLGSPTVPVLNVHFIDASSEAINRLRDDPRYEHAANSNAEKWSPATITSQICDFASNQPTLDQSADIILLLFVLSAIGPYQRHHHQSGESLASGMLVRAVQHAANMLKHDGVILFQDYARYDDDQLQLNSVVGAQICDNFYVRCDDANSDRKFNVTTLTGTGCYFFDLDEVRELFTNAGLEVLQLEYVTSVNKKSGKNGRDCSRNGGAVSRTRVWVLGRFRKTPRCLE